MVIWIKTISNFVTGKKNKKQAASCHSTVNKPLFDENPDVKVLEKCVVPELHVMQGFVNHLFWNSLVHLVGREKVFIWLKKLNIVPQSYHGEVFEGNDCKRLLETADELLDPKIHDSVGYFAILPYVTAFKTMNKIVKNSFSHKVKNKQDLQKSINDIKLQLKSIDVTETLKIHVLISHVIECLEFLFEYGLGVWSEQAGESVHSEFLKFWSRYKINDIESEGYLDNLFDAVVEFSLRHI